jgi:hypothetical protein
LIAKLSSKVNLNRIQKFLNYHLLNFFLFKQQEELIKQLQEQHFEQYMNQVYQQQLLHQQQQAEQLRAMRVSV